MQLPLGWVTTKIASQAGIVQPTDAAWSALPRYAALHVFLTVSEIVRARLDCSPRVDEA